MKFIPTCAGLCCVSYNRGVTRTGEIVIRRATAQELIDLRHVVLRAGFPREAAMFDGDDDEDARHFAAVSDGRIVGCVTLHRGEWDGKMAWHLRGMAVAKGLRGNGIGSELLEAAEKSVRVYGATKLIWCNARVPAVRFYEKAGWQVVSEVFDIAESGPHVKMIKRLG